MTADVVAVRADASYRDMTTMLRKYRVSGFPVLDGDGIVVGVVSETDLLAKEALDADPALHPGRLTWRAHAKQAKARGLTAAELMTRSAVTIGPPAARTA